MKLILRVPANRPAERRYVAHVLLEHFLGLQFELAEGAEGAVSLEGDGRRLEFADVLLASPDSEWLAERSLPMTPLASFDAGVLGLELGMVPLLYGDSNECNIAEQSIRLNLDLFGSAFFMLTLYEEIVIPERDKRTRFPAEAAISVREGFIRRPVVNEYTEILWACISRLWPALERKTHTYRVVPTHDIDVLLTTLNATPLSYVKAVAGDLTRRKDPFLALQRTRAFLSRGKPEHDPCRNYGYILDCSERRGLKSSFFFICGVRPEVVRSHYDPKHPVVLSAFDEIARRGHEIGLHPGYGTFKDPQALQAEFHALQESADLAHVTQPFFGGRQHGLQWENPTTWRLWNDAGLIYDSSVGFAAAPGFRSGTCYPYPVFDLKQGRALDLVERPLIAMDTSYEEYLKKSPEAAHRDIAELAATCKRYGGEFVGLWHNNRLITRSQRLWYERTLEAIA